MKRKRQTNYQVKHKLQAWHGNETNYGDELVMKRKLKITVTRKRRTWARNETLTAEKISIEV